MKRSLRLRTSAFGLVGALALAALVAACGGSSSNATPTPGSGGSASSSPAQQDAAAISAINIMDNAGLHDFDAQIASGTVPPTAETVAEHLQTIALLTDWPSTKLQAESQKMASELGAMATSLATSTPDMKAAGAAAHTAHEDEHLFSSDVWAYLEGKAGVKGGGGAVEAVSPSPSATP